MPKGFLLSRVASRRWEGGNPAQGVVDIAQQFIAAAAKPVGGLDHVQATGWRVRPEKLAGFRRRHMLVIFRLDGRWDS